MSRNGALIPESKQALQNFKYEVANSLNVDLKQVRSAVKWSNV